VLIAKADAWQRCSWHACYAGIDVEPDHSDNLLRGVLFSDVLLQNNKRCGFSMAPYAMQSNASSAAIDVTVDGMVIRGVPGTAYNWGRAPDRNPGGIGMQLFDSYNNSGSVAIRNLNISGCYAQAVYVNNWPADYVSLAFEGLTISNSTLGVGETRWKGVQVLSQVFAGEPVSPVVIMPGSCENSCDMRQRCARIDPTLPSGGIIFSDTIIYDHWVDNRSRPRPWLSRIWTGTHGHAKGGLLPPPLKNLSGRVKVVNSAGCPPAEVGPNAVDIDVKVDCVSPAEENVQVSPLKHDDGDGAGGSSNLPKNGEFVPLEADLGPLICPQSLTTLQGIGHCIGIRPLGAAFVNASAGGADIFVHCQAELAAPQGGKFVYRFPFRKRTPSGVPVFGAPLVLPDWTRGAFPLLYPKDGQGLATTLLLGAGAADGKADVAGWLAIVGGHSDGRPQSTWAEACAARGFRSERQAMASAATKLVCWHWSQPCAYLKYGLGTAAVSEHRTHRLFSYTYLTSHVLSVQSTSRVCWLTVTVTMAYRMTCL
jgi:hypothetical protein